MASRALFVVTLVGGLGSLAACGHHKHGEVADATVDTLLPPDACSDNLTCFQVDCNSKGLPPTSLSGTIYAPNGTLPLFGVNVYVPFTDPGALETTLTCDRCADQLPGGAVAATVTDEAGHFEIDNVPATANVPVVIQVGKWRRQIVIPNVAACQGQPIPPTDTRLPSSYHDTTPLTALDSTGAPKVDMPKIAISTGGADALECLPLKLGVDPTEITNDVGTGHVHLYTNNHSGGQGALKFQANWPGSTAPTGDAFGDSETMWGDFAHLSAYDIVMFSCEGGQFPDTKPETALDAVEQYANQGGRVFMTHWHNIWISGTDPGQDNNNPVRGEADWMTIGQFNFGAPQNDATQLAVIDETVPKGMSYATWMLNVGGSTVRDQVPVSEPRYTLQAADATKSSREVWVDPAQELATSDPAGETSIQDLQFTTPVGVDEDQKCGKVVFSDMHVSSGSHSSTGVPYPDIPHDTTLGGATGCAATDLSPQEKALAFIFFDIASCVGGLQ